MSGESLEAVHARVPVTVTWELDRVALALGLTRSEVVRRALVLYLRRFAERVDDPRAPR